MSANVQERVAKLINANKQRKVHHLVAGSMVKFTSQTSQTFSRTTATGEFNVDVRIKFVANTPGANGKSLVNLFPQASISPDFTTLYPRLLSINEPQAGDGSIILHFVIAGPYAATTFYFRAISAGATGGTFSLL